MRAQRFGDELVSRAVPAAAAPMREKDGSRRLVRNGQFASQLRSLDRDQYFIVLLQHRHSRETYPLNSNIPN